MRLLPVVLAGGLGTRLAPLSTAAIPKQFLALLSDKSLLQETVLRLQHYDPANSDLTVANPLIVSSARHEQLLQEQLAEIAVRPSGLIFEPFRRNTAPAITLAALQAQEHHDDPILLILPSDHFIQKSSIFYEALNQTCSQAMLNRLVTFGVVPNTPETDYGYIQMGESCGEGYIVQKFIEKPPIDVAKRYLKEGGYLWNSGMFVGRASVFVRSMAAHAPDVLKICQETMQRSVVEHDIIRVDASMFADCPAISMDHAVMEKLDNAVVIPLDAGWIDLGSLVRLKGVLDTRFPLTRE